MEKLIIKDNNFIFSKKAWLIMRKEIK
jgi:hypothetical protein